MLKKIITLCIFLLILCCCNNSLFAYEDVNDANSKEAIEFLSAQGILNGYDDGTFKPSENVTRAEFATIIMKVQNLGSVGATDMTYYPDVTKGYWALADINMATSFGLISGYDDGTFRPEDNITVTDAAKIIVCSLGYQTFAQSDGGYPGGYINVAINNGIFNNIKSKYDEYATRDDVAQMVYNALEVNKAEWVGDECKITDKTLLDDALKVFKKSGVITATKYAEIVPTRTLFDDEIAVDNIIYKITDEFIHELVGYDIDFYVKEENDELVITYYVVNATEKSSVMIEAEDINYSSSSIYEICYYDENGKTQKARLDTDYVTKNGVSVYLDDKSVFDILDGNILLIDTDKDGKYESVFVNAVKNIIVGRINKENENITDKFSATKKLNLSDDEKNVTIRYNNEEITFEDIVEGDIITYSESSDGSRIIAYVSRNVITGTLKSINYYEQGCLLEMDNENVYKMSGECLSDLKESESKMNAIVPNITMNIYINVYNEIAFAEIKGVNEEKYAFLVTAFYDDQTEEATLTMWPESGSVQRYVIDNKINFSNGTVNGKVTPQELVERLARTRITDSDEYVNNPYFQLIKVRFDENEQIRSIKTAMSSNDGTPLRLEGAFTRDFLTTSSITTNKKDLINGAYKFSEDVKIFNIPPEHNDYTQYSDSVSFSKNVTATVAIYDMNEGNLFDAILIINPNYDSYYDNSQYKPFFTYDHIAIVADDDNEIAYDVYGVYNRGMRSFRFDEDPGFNEGDIYQFLEVNEKVIKANKIYDAKTESFAAGGGTSNAEGLGIKGGVSAEVVLGTMKVRNINSDSIVLTDGEGTELLLTISASTKCVLNMKDEIRSVDISELEVDDKVTFRTFNGTAGDLVIIR